MKFQLIRNATLKLDYAGSVLLIDPCFAPRYSQPALAGRSANPLVELPFAIADILKGVELVIVSHLHEDHFDSVAMDRIPKHIPIYCQPGDEAEIRAAGFTEVTPLVDKLLWKDLTITRREGSHGLGPVLDEMGEVMGFSLEAEGQPSLYWTGDTVLYPPVAEIIQKTKPDIIVTHSCGARWDSALIVMDALETIAVCENSGSAIVIATHMEALDHATVGREDLRDAATLAGISRSKLLIPADGSTLILD